MKRPITNLRRDDEGHWLAELSCGHRQHVRHVPRLSVREWVLTEAERSGRIETPVRTA